MCQPNVQEKGQNKEGNVEFEFITEVANNRFVVHKSDLQADYESKFNDFMKQFVY